MMPDSAIPARRISRIFDSTTEFLDPLSGFSRELVRLGDIAALFRNFKPALDFVDVVAEVLMLYGDVRLARPLSDTSRIWEVRSVHEIVKSPAGNPIDVLNHAKFH